MKKKNTNFKKQLPLDTVTDFNIDLYMGTWYEIGTSFLVRLFIETFCTCTKAEYTLNPDGSVRVYNTCRAINKNGPTRKAEGLAVQTNPQFPGQLTVTFGNMAANEPNYYIIHLDVVGGQYVNALIGDPSRRFLWILSRDPIINDDDYFRLLDIAEDNGFNVEGIRFRKTNQSCYYEV